MKIIRNTREQNTSEIFSSYDISAPVGSSAIIAIALNPNRVKFLISNTGNQDIYGSYSGSVSSANYSFLIAPTTTYVEDRFVFQGNIWIVSPLESTYTYKDFV